MYLSAQGSIPSDYPMIVLVFFLASLGIGAIPCTAYSLTMEFLAVKLLSVKHGVKLYIGTSILFGIGVAGILHAFAEYQGIFGVFWDLVPASIVSGLITAYILLRMVKS